MDKGRDQCIEEAKNYTSQAREHGSKFDGRINENELVVAYRQQLKFIADNNLIDGVLRRIARFD